ncbi:MAG TPA: hypothetical protein VF476_07600, partial [Chitinophagaceae bacterium]
MKSYLGTCHLSASESMEATVLLFDKEVHIGYRYPNGHAVTMKWPMAEVDASYEMSRQSTRLRHTKQMGVEVFVNGNDAAEYVKERQAEHSKP